MALRGAIAAFAYRGARGGAAWTFGVYSAVLAGALFLLAAGLHLLDREPLTLARTLATADLLALWALTLAGFVVTPALVAAAVSSERRAGTLDQLRTTALSPLELSFGFVLGVPARLYVLCLGPALLHVLAALGGVLPLSLVPGSLVLLAVGTFTSAVIGLCVALSPQKESGGALPALAVAAGLGGFAIFTMTLALHSGTAPWAFLHPAGGLSALLVSAPTPWAEVAVPGWLYAEQPVAPAMVPLASAAVSLVVAALALRAACRKLRAPQLPLLSKTQALGTFALAAACLLVPYSGMSGRFDGDYMIGCSLVLLPVLLLLAGLATPSFETWALALRRGSRPGWRDDAAAPYGLVWAMEALWLAMLAALHGPALAHALTVPSLPALAWGLLLALSLPSYLLFGSTRYQSPAARSAIMVTWSVHLVLQLIGMAMLRSYERNPLVLLCALAGVGVPGWVAWRQFVLRRRVLA